MVSMVMGGDRVEAEAPVPPTGTWHRTGLEGLHRGAQGPMLYLGCSLRQPTESLGRNPHTLPKGREVPGLGILRNPCHRLAQNLQNKPPAIF